MSLRRRLAGGVVVITCFGAVACDRYGETFDIDGQRPEKLDGTVHVSWIIDRMPAFESIGCGNAHAQYVLMVMDSAGRKRTYRMRCDLPSREAWIPTKRGDYVIRAELVDDAEQRISKTPDIPFLVRSEGDQLNIPLVFVVR